MKKITLFAAAFLTVAVNAQDKVTKTVAELCNYIDFQALYEADNTLKDQIGTSSQAVELPNGTLLWGYKKADDSEAQFQWNVKDTYNTAIPLKNFAGVDTIKAGTMWRAASGLRMELGDFNVVSAGKIQVFFQPNGDSERGVSITIGSANPVEFTGSGVKENGIRPAYVAELDLPVGSYPSGEVVITLITNTSNIFGVNIVGFSGNGLENLNVEFKARKVIENGQVYIIKNGIRYTMLGTIAE